MRYFEDIEIGGSTILGRHQLSAAEITDFGVAYDPQPFHVDEERARASQQGRLIASGFQTLCIANRIVVENFRHDTAGIAGLGLDEVRWPYPVEAGDEIVVHHQVTSKRPSETNDDRGIIVERIEATNQHGDPVLAYTTPGLFARQPGGD